jgi:hypothetical protein
VARIALDLAPDVLDVCVDSAVERLTVLTAEDIEELGAREDAARMTRQSA